MKIIKDEVKVSQKSTKEFQELITEIIDNVKSKGDKALFEYTEKFDGIKLDHLRVSEEEINEAKSQLDEQLIQDMQFSVERITEFAKLQRETLTEFEKEVLPGVHLGQKVIPIESVGAYIPGGRYPLLSSAQMAIIPAKIAGAKKISVFTPPRKNGKVHPAVLYAAHLSGATDIYKVGGAHAIAAMAHGTESIKKVNKITGPGNKFVTEAKRQVNGTVGIDLLAGPSEVLVFADETANPTYIAADLLAQSEHDPNTQAILVSNSEDICNKVLAEIDNQLETLPTAEIARESWTNRGKVILASDFDEGVEIVNDLASEHLHVHIKDAVEKVDRFTNYGSLFLGEKSSVVFSDKTIGTNHILPTNEAAKYTGGVWVGTFLKVVTYQYVDDEGVNKIAPYCVRQSEREGLIGHLRSANVRLTGKLDID